MMALLEVYGLNKRFGGLHAVKDVSFTLQTGSITGVLGPNGAGKTTMFNLLTGFVPFDTGTVNFDGQALGGSLHIKSSTAALHARSSSPAPSSA